MRHLSYLVAIAVLVAGAYYGKLLYDRDLAIAKAKESPGLRASAKRFEEKARLFLVLTAASRPHKFVGASDLVAVTLAATGVRHIARIVKETPELVKMSLQDGRELEVRPDQIKKREKLPANAWSDQQRAAIEKKTRELTDPSALELFHVAFDAFEVGLPEDGARLLERALAHPAGGAIVDVYGTGDLEVLHRAQERLAAAARAGGVESPTFVSRPDPRPRENPVGPDTSRPSTTTPEPSTKTPDVEPDEPPRMLTDLEKLQADRHWQDAQAAYKKGVDLYRVGFKGITSIEKKSLKDAEAELTKARGFLDQLPRDLGTANSTCDEFNAKVNEILRAVKKQRAATGS
ncbi:hypothetical protein HY251_04170 [bacterium]|nr:hypothetical protein [bacterium]